MPGAAQDLVNLEVEEEEGEVDLEGALVVGAQEGPQGEPGATRQAAGDTDEMISY